MKVVVEKARKFICLTKTKFLCLENFPFHNQQVARSVFQSGIHLLLSGTISEEALITQYFDTIETCERLQVNLSIRADEELTLETACSLFVHCGYLTLIISPDAKFGVPFSHRRETTICIGNSMTCSGICQ